MYNTPAPSTLLIAAAVVAGHLAMGAAGFNHLQSAADRAVMQVVTAEPIVVTAKAPRIVKAAPIIVRAHTNRGAQVVQTERVDVRDSAA